MNLDLAYKYFIKLLKSSSAIRGGKYLKKTWNGKRWIYTYHETQNSAMGIFDKFKPKKYSSDYQGNEKIAEYWTKQLQDAKSMGLHVPSNVKVLSAEEFLKLESEINDAQHSIAAYIEKDDTIYINSKHAYVWEDVEEYIKQAYKANYISTNNINHIALHEIAHKEHFEKGKGNRYKLNHNEKILISKYISDYAAHDLANFIAEFKVKLWNDPNLLKQIDKMKKDDPMKLLYELYIREGGE